MSNKNYSKEICAELFKIANNPALKIAYKRTRYEAGDKLDLQIEGVYPAIQGSAVLMVEEFIGGGFAGQVYRCRLEELNLNEGKNIEGLEAGKVYAVKIIVPPTAFSLWFRNLIYWLAFQGPFSAQVNYGACRSGLIFQKLLRRAGKIKFGRENAIKDAFASFYDPNLNSYGEITEWVEGRMWLLESDRELRGRKNWKTIPLAEAGSPEYIAKRRFMANMVELMHEMGASELARQYEWWTMKSQTNSLRRTDLPDAGNLANSFCAIDFRVGMALLPFLPMSPADIKLIIQGLIRGALTQFDRFDIEKSRIYFEKNAAVFFDMQPAIREFFNQDRAYRRSLPDIFHHNFRLLTDSKLRNDARAGLIEGYLASGLVDSLFSEKLKYKNNWLLFISFYFLGAFLFVGRILRKLWGNISYRQHIFKIFTDFQYMKISLRSRTADILIDWHRAGRADERHVEFLLKFPIIIFFERFTLGILPTVLHSLALRPARIWLRFCKWFLFLRNFISNPEFRKKWLINEIEIGEKNGTISNEELNHLKSIVADPFVARYLKYLGVHFSSAVVTKLFSISTGFIWAIWLLSNGHSWSEALAAFGLALVFFQVIPISPGSIFRGAFVIYLMIRERNLRRYIIAAPVSFLKYFGYFAFPLQMATVYPHLARFMAGRWATEMARLVPVFGEKGALLEHLVFDSFFNYPQKFFIWMKPRIRGILDIWILVGLSIIGFVYFLSLNSADIKFLISTILIVAVIFIFPRIVFYPLIAKKEH